jgi:predicted 3-demethylubiquinone-9 3-methyltransferase (glyoxalase superfamily)
MAQPRSSPPVGGELGTVAKKSRIASKVKVSGLTPFLWFDGDAEPAARFYVSLFARSKMGDISHFGDYAPGEKGKVLTVEFEIDGQPLVAINGGPNYKLSPAFSLMVSCPSQKEVDALWAHFSKGGTIIQCGWITDRFGVTWQVVPARFLEMIQDPDAERADRVMAAMMKMKKLVVKHLEKAYRGP